MALTADRHPHFTTVAEFVATLDKEVAGVFRDVLTYSDGLGLIGKDTFAIDGANTSKIQHEEPRTQK